MPEVAIGEKVPKTRIPRSRPAAGTGGRPTAEQSRQLASTILEAAWEMFLRGGYRALNMDDLARAARVSKRTIYTRFGDKEGLLEAVLAHAIQRWREQAVSKLELHDSSDWPRPLVAHLLDLLTSEEIVTLSGFMAAEGSAFPKAARAVREERDAAIRHLAEMLAAHAGPAVTIDHRVAAACLALIQGYATIYRQDLQAPAARAGITDEVTAQCRKLLDDPRQE